MVLKIQSLWMCRLLVNFTMYASEFISDDIYSGLIAIKDSVVIWGDLVLKYNKMGSLLYSSLVLFNTLFI